MGKSLRPTYNASGDEKESGYFLGSSKASPNLLTEFGYPDSPIGFVIGERNLWIEHKEKNGIYGAFEEGLGGAFFLSVRISGCCETPHVPETPEALQDGLGFIIIDPVQGSPTLFLRGRFW